MVGSNKKEEEKSSGDGVEPAPRMLAHLSHQLLWGSWLRVVGLGQRAWD
jgi:hypothetical protein